MSTMIFKENSYFKSPPKILAPKQVVIFNAIRYSLDICDICFDRLKKNLYNFSYKIGEKTSFPELYSDIWSIIQNSCVFYKIVCQHFKIHKDNPIFEKLFVVKQLRDSSQHIDERITEVLSKQDLSIYGNISWYSQEKPESKEGKVTTLFSGSITDKNSIKATMVNPVGKLNNQQINDIEFTGIIKPNRRKDIYEEATISINDLMMSLEEIITYFERQIDARLKTENNEERHTSDLIFEVFFKKSLP